LIYNVIMLVLVIFVRQACFEVVSTDKSFIPNELQ
jgi:hypothetical protein